MKTNLQEIPLFNHLSDADLAQLDKLNQKKVLPAGATLMEEGEESYDFYFITSGKVEILKKSDSGELYQIRTLEAGDLVGEIAFLEEGTRSSTVRTIGPTELLMFDGKAIMKDPANSELYSHIAGNMGKSLSERLRYTNKVTVKSMQAQLEGLKAQVAIGNTMMEIIFMTALYIFSLGVLTSIKGLLPSTTPITVGMLILLAISALITIKFTGEPLSNYGLTLKNWQRVTIDSILYSLPLMGLVLLAKWYLITFFTQFHGYALFQPFSVVVGSYAQHYLFWYVVLFIAYSLFCPVQEFVARGALQSTFQRFMKRKPWICILLPNLLFSAFHIFISLTFAMLAFWPGLFWGWMYYKQRSLIGCSLSHILLGVWVAFVVGFPGLV